MSLSAQEFLGATRSLEGVTSFPAGVRRILIGLLVANRRASYRGAVAG